jgi:hypothetical protein
MIIWIRKAQDYFIPRENIISLLDNVAGFLSLLHCVLMGVIKVRGELVYVSVVHTSRYLTIAKLDELLATHIHYHRSRRDALQRVLEMF